MRRMNLKASQIIKCIVSLPKSIFFCFKYLPLKQAMRVPILISYKTKIKDMSGGGINYR